MKKQKNVEETDEIKIIEKYKSLPTDKKILFCLYALIIILLVQTILPYIVPNRIETVVGSMESADVSAFDEIEVAELKDIANSGNYEIVYIGRPNCEYCIQFIPVLQQAQKEFGYKIRYLNLDNIKSDEDIDKILLYDNKDGFIAKSFGNTPMVLIIKDNTLVEGWVGYSSYEDFENFLTTAGVNKK